MDSTVIAVVDIAETEQREVQLAGESPAAASALP